MKRWTKKEKEQIINMFANGKSYTDIATELQRSVDAVKKKVWALKATPRRKEYLDCMPNPFTVLKGTGFPVNFYRTI